MIKSIGMRDAGAVSKVYAARTLPVIRVRTIRNMLYFAFDTAASAGIA